MRRSWCALRRSFGGLERPALLEPGRPCRMRSSLPGIVARRLVVDVFGSSIATVQDPASLLPTEESPRNPHRRWRSSDPAVGAGVGIPGEVLSEYDERCPLTACSPPSP